MKKRVIFKRVLIVTLGIFIIAEISLRILYYEQLKIRAYPLIYRPDEVIGYKYIPNSTSRLITPSISKKVVINKQGFYGPSFETEKEPGTFRIIIVGASQATGIWMDGDENYSKGLQKLFRESGKKVEVLNCSIDGRSRDIANIKMIQNDLIKFSPDLVLLETDMPFIQADVCRDNYKDYVLIYSYAKGSKETCMGRIDEIRSHWLFNFFYHVSYIVRTICKRYYETHKTERAQNLEVYVKKRVQAYDTWALPWSSNRSAEMLKALADTLAAKKANLLIYRPDEDIFFRHIAEKYKLPYMELKMTDKPEFLHQHDGHYNEKAHREIARLLFDSLNRLNIISND